MSKELSLEGLTTEQEFAYASELLGRCIVSLRCGVDLSGLEIDMLTLRHQAKEYIKSVEEIPT